MKHIKILDVFYGNKCNLACSQCDTRSDVIRHTGYDPTIDDIRRGIDLANKTFDVENWSVLGGEPLLYKKSVLEIIKHIRSIEPNKTIFFPTNGLLLDKNINFVAELIDKYKVWVQVCNHTARFENKTLTQKIISSTEQIANKLSLPKLDPTYDWWHTIMKLETGTPNWLEYVKKRNLDHTDEGPNEAAWMKENYGIYYMEAHEFQTIHNYVDGKPKPFKDNDPESSYWNSCPSVFCAILYNKKVYKCAALATLRNFLDTHNVLDDPDWQPYLNYQPVDLETASQEQAQYFADTHYCHVDACAMCPSKRIQVDKTETNVLPTLRRQV